MPLREWPAQSLCMDENLLRLDLSARSQGCRETGRNDVPQHHRSGPCGRILNRDFHEAVGHLTKYFSDHHRERPSNSLVVPQLGPAQLAVGLRQIPGDCRHSVLAPTSRGSARHAGNPSDTDGSVVRGHRDEGGGE
jgi:hypothetical protein